MKTPVNRFKQAILNKQVQYGLWVSMGSAYSTEICAGAGFDWLLLDCEHAPNDLQSILMQLQITAAYPDTHSVVRMPVGHGHAGVTLIKQFMDAGATTILVPMVDTTEQAHPDVKAAIEDAFRRILKAGKAPGILTPDETLARHYLEHGGVFVAVGTDSNLLARHTSALCQRFKNPASTSHSKTKAYPPCHTRFPATR